MREIMPQEVPRGRGKPGIITQRRMIPSVVVPYRPPPRHTHYKEAKQDFSWDKHLRAQHHRWEVQTGAQVRAADAQARYGAGDDALDALVMIQAERQRRLASIRSAPPVVHRLYAPQPEAAPRELDALEQFAEFVSAQGGNARAQQGETKAFERDYWGATGRYRGKGVAKQERRPCRATVSLAAVANAIPRPTCSPAPAPQAPQGLVTRMGLHYAHPE